MTVPTYSAITDAALQAGQPITTTLMFQMRDNPLSIIGGDASAPRIEPIAVSPKCFSAYRSSSVNLSSQSVLAVAFNVENSDIDGEYNTSNGRYTPQVAGLYYFTSQITVNPQSFSTNYYRAIIYKNTSAVAISDIWVSDSNNNDWQDGNHAVTVSALVYMNGSTDYVYIGAQQLGSTQAGFVSGSANQETNFKGFMVGGNW